MKIIDAYWDTESLGISTAEVQMDDGDFTNDLSHAFDSIPHRHIVVKFPTGSIATGHKLENLGFRYMETQIDLARSMSKAFSTASESLLSPGVEALLVTSSKDADLICDKVRAGMFTTDRIALDPHFGIEIANQRYANWIKTEYEKGSKLFLIQSTQAIPLGFYLASIDSAELRVLLGGVFSEWTRSHYGVQVVAAPLEYAKKQGFSRITTAVSSNNLPILRQYIHFGYSVTAMKYVYRLIRPHSSLNHFKETL